MCTEIYYFSGTGNSLHVAEELEKRIPSTKLIPIVSLLDSEIIKSNAKTVGFVFPVHSLTIPTVVKKFLKKIDLTSAEYIFAVATRYGTVFKGFKKIDQLLKKKNKHLHSHFILNMGHNEAPRQKDYKVPSESDIILIEKVVLDKLDLIKDVISTKGISREKDTDYLFDTSSNPIFSYLIENTVIFAMNISEYIGGVNYFYHDNKCNGCGTCEKICLSKKIKMVEKKPIWQKKVLCYMCFACLNFCPTQSIQIDDIPFIKSYTTENGRYPHPYATVNDIAKQKKDSNI